MSSKPSQQLNQADKTSTPHKTTKQIHRQDQKMISQQKHVNTAQALNRNRPIFELSNHTQINHPVPRRQPERDISIRTSGLCDSRPAGAYTDHLLILQDYTLLAFPYYCDKG